MKKRILSCLLIMSLVISLVPTSILAAEDEYEAGGNVPELVGTTYQVDTADKLLWVAMSVSSGNNFSGYTIKLLSDIDLSNTDWISIGYNLNNYFAGTFDGQNHVIRNYLLAGSVDSFSVINTPRHTAGLFGVCKNAIVKNLYIENATLSITNESGYSNSYSSINGTSVYGGIVCGYSTDSTFQNIIIRNSSVNVYTGAESAYAYAGGICGYAERSDFIHCGNESGLVKGTSQSLNSDAYIGGIVGELSNEATVRQCYNMSNIYGGHTTATAYIGGIIGKTTNYSSTLSSIRDCYNQGQVTHSGSYLECANVGGIIGYSSSSVNRCYNSGSVQANTNTFFTVNLAGIAGSGLSSSLVSNSAVMSSTISGGTTYVIAGAGIKDNNIANNELSATNDSDGRYATSNFFGSTIYADVLEWDFKCIWNSNEGKYPTLQYIDADNENDIQLVEEAANAVKIIFASGDYYDKVTKDIMLTYSPNSSVVTWESTNTDILSNEGIVNRQDEDYQVKMIATISSGDYSVTKNFVLNIVGYGFETKAPIVAENWGLSIDAARSFVALMRGVRFKDIAVDDTDVQVLIGKNINEKDVVNTLMNVMSFWEVPEESEFLKSQMGDVIGTLKAGEDKVMSSLVSDLSDGLVSWDSEDGSGKLNGLNVAKMFMKVNENVYNTTMEYVDGYKAIKGMVDYEFDTTSPVTSALNLGDKVGNVFNCIIQYSGRDTVKPSPSLTCGKVSGCIKNAKIFLELISAWNKEMKNSTKAYLRLYYQNRQCFESADDEYFRLIMDSIAISNCVGNEDTLDTLAETLYQLNQKFGGNISDKYKIVIKCPVDVVVYDSSGKIVGRVVDNEVDTSISNSLRIEIGGVNADEKSIYVQDDEEYTLYMTGNDDGMMTVSVESLIDGVKENYDYNNIVLEDGKEMTFSIASVDLGNELPPIYIVKEGILTEEIETVDRESEKYLLTIYPCKENSDGTMELITTGEYFVSDYVSAGEDIRSMISVNDGYVLEGLYTDYMCTDNYSTNTMPNKELVLYAKLMPNTWEINIPGDANGDGKTDLKDSAIIKRYLAGWDVEINMTAADMDEDGKVTIKDSALIKRQLAG